jgi:hypothetical protein
MTPIIDTKPKRRLSAKLAAVLAISAILAVGTFAGSASAAERWVGHRVYHHPVRYGGYYRAPPVVYGTPYRSRYYGAPYYAPPVVYGPGIGIAVPGVRIGIR